MKSSTASISSDLDAAAHTADQLRVGPADAERAIAALQRHLLPEHLPVVPGYDFAAFYQPCDAAGGDFYGFQAFADGRIGFVVADVAGHGAQAAVMMAALRGALAAFRVFGRPRETAPQDINAIVHEIAIPGMFITAFFVSLDTPTGTLYCGNCGHPPAIIVRADGRHERVNEAGDLPLGIVPIIDPPMMTVALERGDAMILYTDGVTEARNHLGHEFGEELLTRTLAGARAGSAQQLCDTIVEALRTHMGATPASDDQCVLVCWRH
ncbi:MAG: PP2C family protein-serine/threonine phosphatase [Phycisphaerales bacterium]